MGDEIGTIDTTCAIFKAENNITNLQFTNPDWSQEDFETYLIQDGYYQLNYTLIVAEMGRVCQDDLPPDVLNGLVTSLNFNFSQDYYEERYQIDMESQHRSPVLFAYYSYYLSHTECRGILSSMLPCLCIYPAIAKALSFNFLGDTLPFQAQNWLDDNLNTDHYCTIVQEAVGMVGGVQARAANGSMKLEIRFFNQEAPPKY
eukprot:CAMPEP_0201493162 /NCGR_PEP_ID=MMETSP0151_2-20130828/36244_1 /ASSEMBLY_ACC=CAM_ASM_000257 /TAXON_ID=200890 /ORGANISM="Paramoeba atlantica, Strain 621/1 / CCAP 1560/9" /LENGTH=201 /DNA_ID=CAMNT_0047880349 /DNA_START=213 /DNA_END=818 /DNA_ORIENTATION=-